VPPQVGLANAIAAARRSVPPVTDVPGPPPESARPPALDQARHALLAARALPAVEQVGALDEIHRLLQTALATAGQATAAPKE